MITKMVTCWKLQLAKGKLLYFTDADQNIIIDNEIYLCGGYFTPNAVISSNELAQDNFTISGVIDNELITKDALMKGEFSNAYLEVFLMDLSNLNQNRVILKTGWLGEIKYTEYNFVATVSSLSFKTNNLIGKCYSSTCRAEFGDQYCKKNKHEYSFDGIVSAISDNNSFFDITRQEPDDYFSKGILFYKDVQYMILSFHDNKITVDSIFDLEIKIGDPYKIIAGCDKRIETCIGKFNNAINFRGEPYIPSRHKLI